jgi:hypothetical protein
MIVIAAALMLAGADQAALRRSFNECLKMAATEAKGRKLDAEGFLAFAKTSCGDSASPFQASLANTNVSHGMSRKAAAADAASQVEDYYKERLENYKIELQPLPPLTPTQDN